MKITVVEPSWYYPTPVDASALMKHVERCGRVAYKSEDRITSTSAYKFIRNICKRNHVSVLEHASITVGSICSRSCSHQLVRHRISAITQESMRFCNYGKLGLQVICPPRIGLLPCTYHNPYKNLNSMWSRDEDNFVAMPEQQQRWLNAVGTSYEEYLAEIEEGVKPEDARFLLPTGTKTEVMTTYNLRTWQHVFRTRCDPHAQWEIRGIMRSILSDFARMLPAVFADLDNELPE